MGRPGDEDPGSVQAAPARRAGVEKKKPQKKEKAEEE